MVQTPQNNQADLTNKRLDDIRRILNDRSMLPENKMRQIFSIAAKHRSDIIISITDVVNAVLAHNIIQRWQRYSTRKGVIELADYVANEVHQQSQEQFWKGHALLREYEPVVNEHIPYSPSVLCAIEIEGEYKNMRVRLKRRNEITEYSA